MNPPPHPSRSAIRILIAEDSPTQAQSLQHILRQQGYEVVIATNGRQALELAPQFRPSLIISDVVMPEMNGYEFTHRIKADPALRDTPVFLVTTLSDPADVIRGLECGADSFVLKPYNEQHLMARVHHALVNREFRQASDTSMGVEIQFNGHKHYITADRLQILNLLLATYEAAIQRNKALSDSQQALSERSSEVHKANRFLDSVIEHMPDPVFIKDAGSLRYLRINRATEEITGLSQEQMLGRADADIFAPDQAALSIATDREVLASGAVVDIPALQLHSRTRGVRILHMKKAPVFDEYGQARYILSIAEDVTRQKEMEHEILALNARLEQRAQHVEAINHDLESFCHSASHDLRSPLAVIGGYAARLEKTYAGQLDETGVRYLAAIRNNVRRMGTLVDDLLAFSKLSHQEVKKGCVDMDQLVEQVLEEAMLQRPAGAEPRIELGPLPPAQADAALMRQVWVNLLTNALKYSSKSAQPVIVISGQRQGGEAVYSVRDNGAGFDMAHYDKLFAVFQRLHGEDQFQGTGVGLAIAERVVTRHGGRIWAEGKVNEGAAFFFSLPD